MSDAGRVQATFAATLVDEWTRGGIHHAVVSPGSRSTPLALALERHAEMTVHMVIDERSAGFMALGIGLASAQPAIVLTTSGTAAVELHPAVVEASQARVPILVCTADRPTELRDVGAQQTIDQAHLYGRAARWYSEPGVAASGQSSMWRSLAARAVAEAKGRPPGPVHLNLAFRDPLLGEPDPLPPGRADGASWHAVTPPVASPDRAGLELVAGALAPHGHSVPERGVIVAGAGAGEPAAIEALARAWSWPLIADPRSGCRRPHGHTVAAFDALLRHPPFVAARRPDAVLLLGERPASKVLAQWLDASGADTVLIERDGAWLDPGRKALVVAHGDPSQWCDHLVERLAGHGGDGGWLASWAEAEAAAQIAIDATLAAHPELTEPTVAREVASVLPEGANLVVSSSMPVRDLEWYSAPRASWRVLSNRGANGIDGVLSTAVGVAIASATPTVVLLGDLAFLHDANGLLGLAERDVDLTVVVVDNRGGGIFSFLPQAASLDRGAFERIFGTPHHVDLATLAAAHGLSVLRPRDSTGLRPALIAALTAPGPHVVLISTDRASNVAIHDEIHVNVAQALLDQRH